MKTLALILAALLGSCALCPAQDQPNGADTITIYSAATRDPTTNALIVSP